MESVTAKRRRTRSMDNNDDETNIREKSVALIKKSLGDDEKAGDVATAIEKAVYDEIEDANDHRYRSRIRSRVSNIMHNIALKEQLLAGTITPPKFAKMTADELASPKLKEWRGKLKVEALEEHMLPEKEVVGLDNTRKIKETID
ncbi:hypothetical protein AB6A40_008409 [Gnathostoma spinigerum]|uniref:TFIIS central domain-containing protein n=1 Tax=Gnathostoma spinigerum TaxID=75299 RepID=A0ABD6EQ92_9BILA